MNMKKTLMAAVALMGGIAMAADSTYSFTYQAALRDEHGLVISNGTAVARNQTVTLRLWDAPTGGNLLWGRTYNVYTDETGLFNLEVSDGTGSKADDAPASAALEDVFVKHQAGDVYIGLFVKGSSGEIVPRQRLFAVPFAAVANDVRKISGNVTVGGNITMMNGSKSGIVISADGISQQSGSSTFQDVVANGTVKASGAITAGGGLAVNGGTVSITPDVTLKAKLTVANQATFSGGAEVTGGNLKVGGSEVVPVPVGGIIMWTQTKPPEGGSWSSDKSAHWAICNGQNGTPDLRGRFVVGVHDVITGRGPGTAYDFKGTGGEERHTLTTGEMPSHRHCYVGDDELEGIETTWDCSTRRGRTDKKYDATSRLGGDYNSGVYYTDAVGSGNSHENRPPYYALYYIMRIN